jgi:hypothetical protein
MLAVGVWHIGLFMVATRPQNGGRHVHTEGHQVGQREPCSPPGAISAWRARMTLPIPRRGLGSFPMSSRRLRSNLSGQKVGQPDRLPGDMTMTATSISHGRPTDVAAGSSPWQERPRCRFRAPSPRRARGQTSRPWSRHGIASRTRPVVSAQEPSTRRRPPETGCSSVSYPARDWSGPPIPMAAPAGPGLACLCSELPQTHL